MERFEIKLQGKGRKNAKKRQRKNYGKISLKKSRSNRENLKKNVQKKKRKKEDQVFEEKKMAGRINFKNTKKATTTK